MGPITRTLIGLESRRGWLILAALLGVMAVVLPVLNLATAPDSLLHVPTYVISILGKYLCYAMLALSLDLVWGFAGVLSLGHGAFFALGGYVMGMHLMRQIGDRSVYGNPDLPDFMVFLDWKELPWYWFGFDSFGFTAIMVLLVPAALAFVFGWLAFRSRITGVYLSIITQAMTYALMLAFFRNEMGFGGNNGLTDFKDLLGFDLSLDGVKVGLYILTVLMLALAYVLCRFVISSRLGRVLMAIRDAENRVRFLGHSVTGAKLFAFTLSAMIAGVAGALYVPQVGIINPSEFSPANSIEIAIWTAVGGRGTLIGPIIGALVVNGAKSFFTNVAPEIWLFFLGALFVGVTLALPKGIVGLAARLRRRIAKPTEPSETLAGDKPHA
jgi:urea transport system permease protein